MKHYKLNRYLYDKYLLGKRFQTKDGSIGVFDAYITKDQIRLDYGNNINRFVNLITITRNLRSDYWKVLDY